ncbi:DUF2891 family protein [Ornithinimicrobium sufpigmenti]|uniref:DUF2891 family protein n=1 Tax=Ornithinimicrobium sufpigmenti TaxID=2508882 RepID=UPI0015E19CA3|nr:DUF2891 family protein [Ornithinimicrobium sp. HY008]
MNPQTPPTAPPSTANLNAWSRIARQVIGTPYPWAPGHVVTGPEDTRVVPHELHPAFHGALDWHSCVHMHWSLATLLLRHGAALDPAERQAAGVLLAERLTPAHLAVEVAYLRERPSFERPYGWAWAAQLAATVQELADAIPHRGGGTVVGSDARTWAEALAPLGEVVGDHVLDWLPRQAYPVRHGKHQNDAFALLLLMDAYARLGRGDVVEVCRSRALDWFAQDEGASTDDEPGGSDFLSPALTEALLMTRLLPQEEVRPWLGRFLPGLGEGAHEHLLVPPTVLDPTDGQGAHLLGLALSRAWALRGLAGWLAGPAADRLRESARHQEDVVLDHITDGHFMATHWLVSFALLAQGEGPR